MSLSDPSPLRTTLLGVGMAALATSLGGVTVVLTRLIVVESDALSISLARYGIAALFLAAVMLVTTRMPRLPRRDAIILAILGVVMFTGFPFFLARALEDTTAARGALLFATMPLVTFLIGVLFRLEKMTWNKGVAILVAMAGTALALGERIDAAAPNALRGDAIMFLTVLCGAIFNVFVRPYLVRYGNLPIVVYTMLVGCSLLLVLAMIFAKPFSGSLAFDLNGWLIVLMLAIPGAALMNFLWGWGLQLITPTQATITVGLNPLTAILLGAVALGEPVTMRVMIGFVLIVSAILLASLQPQAGRVFAKRTP